MEEMRKALEVGEANNPRKATVESVLPGVHQQFTNLHHEVNRVRSGVHELKQEFGIQMGDMGTTMRDLLQEFRKEATEGIRMTLAMNFMNFAVGLAGGQTVASPSIPIASPHPPSPRVVPPPLPTNTTTNTTDEAMPVRPEIKNRHPKSGRAIYEEFYGLGDYVGVPIAGGLAAMDSTYKNKWRLGDTAYNKVYSRMQQISKAVDSEVDKGRTVEDVLQEFDRLFVDKECKGLEHMRRLVVHILPLRVRKCGESVSPNSGLA
jgi:hypothetical protein